MPLTGTYGFGIIGCGVISDTHIEAIRRIPEAEVVAVCDAVEQRARDKAEQYGAQAYTDHREMLKRDDVHVVNVLTPSGHHHVAGIDAARAGKHVICTKPIDVTLEAIDALIAACEENGVKLMATHQCRSFPAYARLKHTLNRGSLGRLLYGNVFVPWHRTQDYYEDGWHGTWQLDGGGALMNQSIHWIDLLLWFMGQPTGVFGKVATMAHNMETEDMGSALVTFSGGSYGLIQGTTCTYQGHPTRLEVHGTTGNVIVVGDEITLWEVAGEQREETRPSDHATGAADPRSGLSEAIDAHTEQITDLLMAIEEDREPHLNGPEARRAVELILAIYRSSETGEEVRLPL